MKFFASISVLLWFATAAFAQPPAQPAPAPAPEAPPTSSAKPAAAQPQTRVGQSTYEDIESILSVSLFYWKPSGAGARLAGGRISPDPPAQTIDLVGRPKAIPGVIITFPTGRSNRLELAVWEGKSSGSTTSTRDYTFFAESFDKGALLVTDNRVRTLKVSWNYLTFPYPPLDSKLRIKTLWEAHYVGVRPTITAPLTAVPASGDTPALPPIRSQGARKIILPALGLGVELVPSAQHFRLEVRGSGMAFPGKSQIWDLEGSAVVRAGNLEVFAGAKLFHYRTAPSSNQYLEGNLWGPYGGVRWVFR